VRVERIVVVAVLWSVIPARADTCIEAAKAIERQSKSQEAAVTGYQKALAAKKAKPVALKTIGLGKSDGQGNEFLPDGWKQYDVRYVDDGGTKVKVLVDVRGSCGGGGTELVQQGSKIFRVERKPKQHQVKIETCTCAYPMRGGCGMRQTAHGFGHVLPPDTTWGGTIAVEYDEDTFEFTHKGLCPPPQPVP
jgi:hypothetical protein